MFHFEILFTVYLILFIIYQILLILYPGKRTAIWLGGMTNSSGSVVWAANQWPILEFEDFKIENLEEWEEVNIFSSKKSYLVQNVQKFLKQSLKIACITDGRTDGRTDRPT